MVPPCSDRISRVPPYSRTLQISTCTGLSPAMARLSRRFQFLLQGHWPSPRSLAATNRVSIDVLSSGYLDVSVRRVCLLHLCIQCRIPQSGGFPHSEIHGSKVTPTSPWLFAGCHVLHRLSTPRHSPNALMALVLRNRRTQGKTPVPEPSEEDFDHKHHPGTDNRPNLLQVRTINDPQRTNDSTRHEIDPNGLNPPTFFRRRSTT